MRKKLKQLSLDELYRLSSQIEQDAEEAANMLFPDNYQDRASLTKMIGQWALNQTVVLESNQNNKIDLAIIFNKVSQRIWNQLPMFAQNLEVNVKR